MTKAHLKIDACHVIYGQGCAQLRSYGNKFRTSHPRYRKFESIPLRHNTQTPWENIHSKSMCIEPVLQCPEELD